MENRKSLFNWLHMPSGKSMMSWVTIMLISFLSVQTAVADSWPQYVTDIIQV